MSACPGETEEVEEVADTGNGNPGKRGFKRFRFESIPLPPAALIAASEGSPAGTAGKRPPRGNCGRPVQKIQKY